MNAPRNTIYVAKPRDFDGPFKIGTTTDLTRRFRNICNASPFDMEIVATMSGGRDVEGRIHARLLSSHLRCEWFEATDDCKAVVAEIVEGVLDVESLPPPKGVSSFIKGKPQSWPPRGRGKPQ